MKKIKRKPFSIRINPIKKRALQKNTRNRLLAFFFLLIIIFAALTVLATQPQKMEETITVLDHEQKGMFSYQIHLKNNSLYEENTINSPSQNPLFKKLIEQINLSYSYELQSTHSMTITDARYEVQQIIKTDLWNKTLEGKRQTSSFDSPMINIEIPINETEYQSHINQITQEIGVESRNQHIEIKATIYITAENNIDPIQETFTHSINIPLDQDIITIEENLSKNSKSYSTETNMISLPTNIALISLYTLLLIISIISFICLYFCTISLSEETMPVTKKLQIYKKKYGEWMVEITNKPERILDTILIQTKSIEDLATLSEERGKPILHYADKKENQHLFYVIDENQLYQYRLQKEV